MGLFGEKEKCAVCSRKTSMLTKVKIADGIICGDCRKKCSPLAKVGLKTVDQVIEHIKAREVNANKVSQFTPTDVVGNYIKVDRNSRTWCCPALDKEPDIFPFSTLIDFELVEEWCVNHQGRSRQCRSRGRVIRRCWGDCRRWSW